MRMNPDGRSHVDFVTVTAEGIPPEDWFGGIETIPVARTISAMSIIIATPPIRSFRERIIGSALKDVLPRATVGETDVLKDRFTGIALPPGLNATSFTTIIRPDGSKQIAYNGWSLYTFVNDKKPGDTNGQGIKGVWFACTVPTLTMHT
jgi:hypothetical protein